MPPQILPHEEIQTLLGAYVLDAVDTDERASIELHLGHCHHCQLEVDVLRTTTSLLTKDQEASNTLWLTIAEELPHLTQTEFQDISEDIEEHAEVATLLAAYVTGGVDAIERNLVEAHLQFCPRCQLEVDEFRADATQLFQDATAPTELWDRISQELETSTSQPATATESSDNVTNTVVAFKRLKRRPVWLTSLAAVAAVIVLAVLGIQLLRGPQTNLTDETAEAFSNPAATTVTLTSTSGTNKVEAAAAVLPDGTSYLDAEDLPALPADKTYQLWTYRNGEPTTAAVLGPEPTLGKFQTPRASQALTITIEPKDGTIVPTTEPIVVGFIVPAGTFNPGAPLKFQASGGLVLYCQVLAGVLGTNPNEIATIRALASEEITSRIEHAFGFDKEAATKLASQIQNEITSRDDVALNEALRSPFCVLTPKAL